jgi:hypothetical protein
MELRPKIQRCSIVLLGDFNPKIFQPSWFAMNNFLSEEEVEDPEIDIIHHDVSSFRIDWLRIEVTKNRFIAETSKAPYYELLFDLVVNTFRVLEQTPANMLGINRDMHFDFVEEKKWNEFGDYLAPKDIWNKLVCEPGLETLTIRGKRNWNDLKGFYRILLKSSDKIKYGVFIDVNDHYEVEGKIGCRKAIDILESNWRDSMKYSEELILKVVNRNE